MLIFASREGLTLLAAHALVGVVLIFSLGAIGTGVTALRLWKNVVVWRVNDGALGPADSGRRRREARLMFERTQLLLLSYIELGVIAMCANLPTLTGLRRKAHAARRNRRVGQRHMAPQQFLPAAADYGGLGAVAAAMDDSSAPAADKHLAGAGGLADTLVSENNLANKSSCVGGGGNGSSNNNNNSDRDYVYGGSVYNVRDDRSLGESRVVCMDTQTAPGDSEVLDNPAATL
jgi:hypothetical protein